MNGFGSDSSSGGFGGSGFGMTGSDSSSGRSAHIVMITKSKPIDFFSLQSMLDWGKLNEKCKIFCFLFFLKVNLCYHVSQFVGCSKTVCVPSVCVVGWMHACIHGRMDAWTFGRTDGRTVTLINSLLNYY